MTLRSLSRRISDLERHAPEWRQKLQQRRVRAFELLPTVARFHTASVAALALAGEPKIDEPLSEAWRRTLVHYGIRECQTEEWAHTHQLDEAPTEAWAHALANDRQLSRHPLKAAEEIYPTFIHDRDEAAIFTKILASAQPWLLKFTLSELDARCLSLTLPDLSAAPKWGSAGLRDARRWPCLPQGIMTAGHPVPDDEDKLPSIEDCMLIPFCRWPVQEWTPVLVLLERFGRTVPGP
jgi:hypothetical protein